MFKKITIASALILATSPTWAAAMLTLDDGTNSVTVIDQSADDVNPIEGIVTAVWTSPDTLWTSTVSIGTTYPADGSQMDPYMDLNAVVTSPGAGTLTITFEQDGFMAAMGKVNSDVGGTLNQNASAMFMAMADGQMVSSIGPFMSAGAFMGSDSVDFVAGSTPYAMSLQAVITHDSSGTTSFDYQVEVPEPGTLALLGLGLIGFGLSRRRVAA
jgi:hypothetical protein